MKKVVIVGAGGQSQAVLEAATLSNEDVEIIGYIDKNSNLHGKLLSGLPVFGDITALYELNSKKQIDAAFVAIGDNYIRSKYIDILNNLGIDLISVIHPKAIISGSSTIGKGVYIGPGAIIGPQVVIEDYSLINMNCSIPHYNKIGKYVNISPNVAMGGGTTIGTHTFIGIGSSLVQYIDVGKHVIVGAGTVVINNVVDNVVIVGCPGKVLKANNKHKVSQS